MLAEGKLQRHWPIGESGWAVHALGRLGVHLPLAGARSFISDRFFLGGVNSFRGFDEKGVRPRAGRDAAGGDLLYSGALHVSYPLQDFSFGTLRGHAFTQLGSLAPWQPGRGLGANLHQLVQQQRAAVGFGLFLRTQLGLGLQLCYTHPLQTAPVDITRQVQFGIYLDFA